MTTLKGQSGSPVIYDNKIIALHIKSGDRDVSNSINGEKRVLFNIGRLITLDLLKNIQAWCDQLEADPFQVDLDNLCPYL